MSPRRVDSTEAASLEALLTENQALRVENQILKDEIARLKGLPPRPPARPRPSSGRETATGPSRSKRRKGRRQTRGAKRDSDRVTREVIVTAEVPEGSRFKGYETLLVRDLALKTTTIDRSTDQHIGLHVDSWDDLDLDRRDRSANRISVNLGVGDRYFLFLPAARRAPGGPGACWCRTDKPRQSAPRLGASGAGRPGWKRCAIPWSRPRAWQG